MRLLIESEMGWPDIFFVATTAPAKQMKASIATALGPFSIEKIAAQSNADERMRKAARPFCQTARFHTAAGGT